MKGKLQFNTEIYPKKELIASCSVCGKELRRVTWEYFGDHSRKKQKMGQEIVACPHCKAVFTERIHIRWETKGGDLKAECQNGDFLIWKWGYGYKWRYRRYGAAQPSCIYWARTRDEAKRACERHAEWK